MRLFLDIIEYNVYQLFKNVLFVMIYIVILVDIILPTSNTSIFLKIIAVTLMVLFIIMRDAIKRYKNIGNLIIDDQKKILIRSKNGIDSDVSESIEKFIYGGYKGEPKEFDLFLSGSFFRDGTKNHILFKNGSKIRFILKTKKEAKILINKIEEIDKQSGFDTRIEKSLRMKLPA